MEIWKKVNAVVLSVNQKAINDHQIHEDLGPSRIRDAAVSNKNPFPQETVHKPTEVLG